MIRAVKVILAAVFAAALIPATVRLKPDTAAAERGVLRLHYVQKPIGYERYEIVPDGDGLALTSDFDFTDRGVKSGLVRSVAASWTRPPRSVKSKSDVSASPSPSRTIS